jgi:peptidoglycan hydrolase CwlO-like protein
MDKDIFVYLILFSLISISAYKNSVDKKSINQRLESVEQSCILLTVKTKKLQADIDAIRFSADSLHNVYLHKK